MKSTRSLMHSMASKCIPSLFVQLNGIFAVNKPIGVTSAKVVAILKAALLRDLYFEEKTYIEADNHLVDQNVSRLQTVLSPTMDMNGRRRKRPKIGHGGTLDMNASGVLVIGCGNATKKLSSYLSGGKIYTAEGRLGRATDTMDASGKEMEIGDFGHVTELSFRDTLRHFTGDILQVPPIYSALKVSGERMSDLVKRGIDVEPKPARPIQIFSLQCLHFNPPEFQIEVHCGGGVYVRKLIHDIGKSLGTCAYMTSLCRTQQGQFNLDTHALPQDRWTLKDIVNALEEFNRMESSVR